MLILSLLTALACALMWLAIYRIRAEPNKGFAGLGAGFAIMGLVYFIQIAALTGCGFALVGLGYDAFVRWRFNKLLSLSLALNALGGPVPYVYFSIRSMGQANPPLVRAVTSGSAQRLQELLSLRVIPPEPDQEGYLALVAAAEAGRMDMIDALATAYAKSNRAVWCAVGYENALILASQYNKPDLVKRLLQAGADPNSLPQGTGFSAADHAVRNGNRSMLRLLLDAGAKPQGPLFEAVGDENLEMVELLLSYAKQDFKRDPQYGSHLLGTAARASYHSEKLTKILLDAGADPNVKPRHVGLPLQTAVTSHNPGVVRLLLEHGADPNDPRLQFNLLRWAERDAERTKDRRVLDILRAHGARLTERQSSAATAALRDSEPRETSTAASVCCSAWFGIRGL
jgi:hypothetical protein